MAGMNGCHILMIMCLLTATLDAAQPATSQLVLQDGADSTQATNPDVLEKLSNAQKVTVTVVNDISAHFEVLAGVLAVLRRAGVAPTTLFTGGPRLFFEVGFHAWMGMSPMEDAYMNQHHAQGSFSYTVPNMGQFVNINPRAPMKALDALNATAGNKHVVICLSPELDTKTCRAVLSHLKPAVFVMFVHRGDQITAKLRTMYPKQLMVALSPHVADACQSHTRMETNWTIPIAPYYQYDQGPCESISCLDGFVIQGAIREWTATNSAGFTRDYARLWRRLLEIKQARQQQRQQQHQPEGLKQVNTSGGNSPVIHVYVLGKGSTSKLGVPAALAEDVQHYSGLPYPEFWGRIHRSWALLPCFGSVVYFKQRLSSTILASIITSTPVVATPRLLQAYRFLTEEHVFMQHEGEDDVAAMERIMAMSETEVFARRKALSRLREHLNARSLDMMFDWFARAMAQPSPEQPSAGARPPGGYDHTENDQEDDEGEDYDDGVFVETESDEGNDHFGQQQQDGPALIHPDMTLPEEQEELQAEAKRKAHNAQTAWRRPDAVRTRQTRSFLTSVRSKHYHPRLLNDRAWTLARRRLL